MNATKEMIYEDETGSIVIDEFNQFGVRIKQPDGYTNGYLLVDVRNITCCICGKGWELKPTSIMDQFACHSARSIVHKTCYEKWLTFKERMLFIGALNNSRFVLANDGVKPIENQYGGAWNTSWFEFTFDKPNYITMTIGSRKRVYSINLKSTQPLDVERFTAAFENEGVTKNFSSNSILLHAWDELKLQDYISRLSLIFDELKDKEAGFVAGPVQTFRLR